VPVIKHLDGNCHSYVDAEVDLDLAVKVTDNAKTQKYSPCNATESLLVHERQAAAFLPRIAAVFGQGRGDARLPAVARMLGVPAPRCWPRPKRTGARNTWRPSSASRW
jgi:glutamate-5-semialdehyde dehydrogenase